MNKPVATILALALSAGACLAFQAEPTAPPQPTQPGQPAQPGPAGRGFRARMPGVNGQITAVTGPTYTVKTRRGDDRKVTVAAGTPIFLPDQKPGTAADLKVGVNIAATGTEAADGTFAATRVNIQNPMVMGDIIAITAGRITVNVMPMPVMRPRNAPAQPPAPAVTAPGKPATYLITTKTVFGQPNRPGVWSDFKVGDRVMVQYKGSEALVVRAFRAGAFGRPGAGMGAGQGGAQRGARRNRANTGNQVGQPVPPSDGE